jgi:hypothetical protein
MGDSELEIVITAVDEASAALAEVGDSFAELSEAATAASTETNESLDSVATTVSATTGQVSAAMQAQQESFALAAEIATQSDQEIIDTMLELGVNAQTAASIVAQSNEEIAESSEEASTVSTGSFTAIGVAAGIFFAAIYSGVSNAVSSAQEWDETSKVITQELKNIGSSIPLSQIQAYAQQIQSTTLFTQQQALSAEAVVLGFSNLAPHYQEITELSADLATKIQQFTGAATADMPNAMKILTNALNDPVAGMNQLIRQGGVEFPAATVTMIENLAKAGDTAGADAVILQALSTQVGGLADTAATAEGGVLTQLGNQLTAMGTTIGNILLPALDSMAKELEPIISEISTWATEHPKLTEAIIAGTAAFFALLAALAVVGIIVAAIGASFAGLAVIIAAAAALIVGVVVANWNAVASTTETVWNGISTFLTTTWNWVKNLFSTSLSDVQGMWNTSWTDMSNFLMNIWNTIQNTVKSGVNDVISAINGFINALDSIHINIPAITIPGTKIGTPAVNLGFNIPDIPMLAAGGIVLGPTLAMLGEAGPEAVVPLSSGMGSAGGMQQIIVNINGGIFPADPSSVKQIGDLLAKAITQNLRVRNYQS